MLGAYEELLYNEVMLPEDRREYVKFFLRLAEISFALMVATPTVGYVLRAEFRFEHYITIIIVGVVGILIFVLFSVIIVKRR